MAGATFVKAPATAFFAPRLGKRGGVLVLDERRRPTRQIDTSKPNIYSMVIGMNPGAEMREIGEVDYEHAAITAGEDFPP